MILFLLSFYQKTMQSHIQLKGKILRKQESLCKCKIIRNVVKRVPSGCSQMKNCIERFLRRFQNKCSLHKDSIFFKIDLKRTNKLMLNQIFTMNQFRYLMEGVVFLLHLSFLEPVLNLQTSLLQLTRQPVFLLVTFISDRVWRELIFHQWQWANFHPSQDAWTSCALVPYLQRRRTVSLKSHSVNMSVCRVKFTIPYQFINYLTTPSQTMKGSFKQKFFLTFCVVCFFIIYLQLIKSSSNLGNCNKHFFFKLTQNHKRFAKGIQPSNFLFCRRSKILRKRTQLLESRSEYNDLKFSHKI